MASYSLTMREKEEFNKLSCEDRANMLKNITL